MFPLPPRKIDGNTSYRRASEGFNIIVFSSSNLFLFKQYDKIPVFMA